MKTPEQYEEIISSQQAEIENLHRQLAAERLRADTAWQRYENANMGQKLAREELARLNAKMAEPDYEIIARKAGYQVSQCANCFYFWHSISKLDSHPYDTCAEAFKACCQDNGLLGETDEKA